MGSKLKFGSSLIRLLLLFGIVVALGGIACASAILASNVDAATKNLVQVVLLAFFMEGAASFAVFAMLASRKLLQRVTILSAAMDHGADGDLTTRVVVTAEDELGMLNRTFNSMVERLAGMAGKVQDSIAELGLISADIQNVYRRGKEAAGKQYEGISSTDEAISDITCSVNDLSEAVEGLASLSGDNVASIMEMSANMEKVTQYMDSLSRVVEEVTASIVEMTATEKQIGGSVNSLMEESLSTAALVAEMDLSIKQVDKNARQTAAISETMQQDAEIGRESVEATITGIGEIRRSSRITSDAIENLSIRAGNIGKILQVIDELAGQTNLLALNASIIAAQAGERGKGFGVVADEIKRLSQRTSASTREIGEIIDGVQQETKRAVQSITLSEQRIAEGELLSQRSGAALHKIVESVQLATNQVDEIAKTTVEQAERSQTMRRSMERVSDMVRQVATATREQAQSSELIISAVSRMKNLTEQVVIVTGEQGGTGRKIAGSSEEVNSRVRSIRHACLVQTGSSRKISQGMENVKASTQTAMETARVMEGVVHALSRQIEVLQAEMSGFRL